MEKLTFSNIKKLLALLLLSICTFNLSNAIADGYVALGFDDRYYYLDQIGHALNDIVDLEEELGKEIGNTRDFASKMHLYRKFISRQQETVRKLQNNQLKIENADIQELNRIVFEGIYELSELNIVFITLFEARETNNLDTLTALAFSLITEEAKHFAKPVLSRIALEYRISTLLERDDFLRKKLSKDFLRKNDQINDKYFFDPF